MGGSHERIKLNNNEIKRLYIEKQQTIEDIRKIFNVNYGTIKLRLIKMGIQLRNASESQKIVMNRPEVKKNISKASIKSSPQRMATCIEKYGSPVAANNSDLRKQWEDNYIQKHNIEWNKDPKRKQKSQETCMNKYQVKNGSQSDNARNKIKQNRWINKSEEELNKIQDKSKFTYFKNHSSEKIKKILEYCDLELLDDFKGMTKQHKYKCKKCHNIFKLSFNTIKQGNKCSICNPPQYQRSSKLEKEILAFLKTITNTKIIENSRQIIPPQELDLYLPEMNTAIEFDGLWYHSEGSPNYISPSYHLQKTIECLKKEIHLIHIFEDEWVFKKQITMERLKNILNINNKQRIHARQCIIQQIDIKIKNKFLNKYHIQGTDKSSIKLGAFYKNELVSVMTFSKGNIAKGNKAKEYIWELNRFCSNCNYHIPGIASKLLTYFKRNFKWIEIYSYADRRWSNGNLYNKLGFNLQHITKPNYWYIKGLNRIHRFNLRKKSNEPKDIPEWALRNKDGYYRIWDCGNLKFNLVNQH